MTDHNGAPPGSAEKSLGEIVNEVSEKASLLVREEIQLAQAEIQVKINRLAKGAAFGAAAGVFLVFVLIYFFHALSWLWDDLFDFNSVWPGFAITAGLLLILGAIAGLLAVRFFKRGAPPVPELAIEEAKKTRATLEEARH
ncbi:MAG TPA: phage holin family protein [Thermoleophilaceae bacterium]